MCTTTDQEGTLNTVRRYSCTQRSSQAETNYESEQKRHKKRDSGGEASSDSDSLSQVNLSETFGTHER